VFPEAALRLVRAHAGRLSERVVQRGKRQPLLVEAVAGLVDRAEERVERAARVEERGHADVRSVARAKRVERNVDAAALVVESQRPRDLLEERALLLHGEALEDALRRLDV